MHHMSDLNRFSRPTTLKVYITSYGEIETFTNTKMKVEQLSGDFNIINKIIKLKDKDSMKEIINEVFGDKFTVDIKYYFKVLSDLEKQEFKVISATFDQILQYKNQLDKFNSKENGTQLKFS
jgi:lipopolysaccharide export system protein LptA